MTIQIDEFRVSHLLVDLYGIELNIFKNESYIELRPSDLEYGHGFIIRLIFGWRSIKCEFIPENYSAALLKTMGEAKTDKKLLFRTIAQSCINDSKANCILRINDITVDPIDYFTWPLDWKKLDLSITIVPVAMDSMGQSDYENMILDWGGRLLGMILALLPLEESTREEESTGLPEGALIKVEVNRYERNSINRQACILINGTTCKVCGEEFVNRYGQIGKGFIHVHHVVPVSMMGSNYIVNPALDLVPVCPNCHAMLHRKSPPYTVEELKASILSSQGSIRL